MDQHRLQSPSLLISHKSYNPYDVSAAEYGAGMSTVWDNSITEPDGYMSGVELACPETTGDVDWCSECDSSLADSYNTSLDSKKGRMK